MASNNGSLCSFWLVMLTIMLKNLRFRFMLKNLRTVLIFGYAFSYAVLVMLKMSIYAEC